MELGKTGYNISLGFKTDLSFRLIYSPLNTWLFTVQLTGLCLIPGDSVS